MSKIIRKKYFNIDSKFQNKDEKHTIFIFVNIKNLKINNIEKKLMHNTNFLLKNEKLYSINKKISRDKFSSFLLKKFNLKDSEYYLICESNINIYLIIVNDSEKKNVKLKDFAWRKYVDLYNIRDEKNKDINKYFCILNESFNSHINNKLFTVENLGNTYIRLLCIYKKLSIHYEK